MEVSDFSSAWMAGVWFPSPHPPDAAPSGTDEISRLLCKSLPNMLRVAGGAGSRRGSRTTPCRDSPSAQGCGVGIRDLKISRFYGWSVGVPPSTLRYTPRYGQRMTRGQDSSLLLSCIGLSPTITCQFVLAHTPINTCLFPCENFT